MIIHAHRALGYGKPENTLAAFQAALDYHHGIELDVRLTSDHDIAIVHDAQLQRVTGHSGIVGQLTLAAIQSQTIVDSDHHIPSFDEVAALLKRYSPLSQDSIAIHVKESEQTPVMMDTLLRGIAEYNLHNEVFIFDVMRPAIDYIRQRDPRVRLAISVGALNHTPTIFTVHDVPKFSDIDIYWMDEWQVPYSVNNEKLYYRFKNEGKKLYVISPDVAIQNGHPRAAKGQYEITWGEVIQWGADGLCTDVPQELAQFLQKVSA